MPTFETVLYQKQDTIAHVVLNRPEVINVYNMKMRDDLYQVLEAVRDDSDVRVVMMSGAGDKGFCAGADLTEFGSAPSQAIARQVRWERDVWGLFLSIRKPLIAALHGYVLGSGVEIAMLCDLRIASSDAVFEMPEVALAMIPAAGGTQTLPSNVGLPRSLEMLLTSRRIDAEEAHRWGLVHRVVPREGLMMEAEDIAKELASRGTEVLAGVKEAVHRGMELPLRDALDLEKRLSLRLTLRSQS